jgi:predicted transcriptional regulator
MNTSLIKKEKGENIIESPLKISRRVTSHVSLKKNDLVTLLREENAALYEDYTDLVKRYAELRKEVGKLHHIIHSFSKSELKLLLAAEELNTETGLMNVKEDAAVVIKEETNTAFTVPEKIEEPKPLEFEKLKARIRSLRKQKVQVQNSLAEKAKFLLALYHSPKGIRPDKLFNACEVTCVTGYRYASFFSQRYLARFSGTNRKGVYSITEMGRKFVQGEEIPNVEVKKTKRRF